MSAVDQTITLAAILPAEPIVVCDAPFLSTLAKVELEIARLQIATSQDAQAASNLLQRLTGAGTKLEAARKLVKAPFLAKCAEIDGAAKAPTERIEAAKRTVKTKVTAYQVAEEEKARQAERAKQEELARLERVRIQEAEEARKRTDELARQAAEAARANIVVEDFDDGPAHTIDYGPSKTATEVAIETIKHAPAVVAAKPTGISFKTTLLIDAIDVSRLPEPFLIRTADERKIRAMACVGWKEGDPMPEISGVTFRVHKEPVSTGRAQF